MLFFNFKAVRQQFVKGFNHCLYPEESFDLPQDAWTNIPIPYQSGSWTAAEPPFHRVHMCMNLNQHPELQVV
jgi:hypothetical protein